MKMHLTPNDSPGWTVDAVPGLPAHIVLHIGYYKTATTLLQRHLFAVHPEITNIGKPNTPACIRRILEASKADLGGDFDAHHWRQEWHQQKKNAGTGRRVTVLSNEGLAEFSAYRPSNEDVLPARLSAIFGPAKVLLTIREQVSLVESLYLHHAKTGSYVPPREWFEDRKDEISNLDYMRMVLRYERAFGAGSVTILPYELLQTDQQSYASVLADALNIDPATCLEMISGRVENKRRSARELAYNAMRSWLLPNVELSRLIPRLITRPVRAYLAAGPRSSVQLDSGAVQQIRERFSSSNASLAKFAGLDLASLGYTTQSDG